MLTETQAETIVSSYRAVQVIAYQKSVADINYDWIVGRSFKVVNPIEGHTSGFLCIEDTNDAFREYDRVEFINQYGDHLTTIELTKSYRIREWFEEASPVKVDKSKMPASQFTIDQRFPVAIYATDETLAPRRTQVEALYRPTAYHAPSPNVQPNPTPVVSVAYKGRRRVQTLSI